MDISEKIKRLRKDNNLTQDEFADIIHVSRSAVALYEKGARTPDILTIQTIGQHFNVSIEDLYDEYIETSKRTNKIKILLLIITCFIMLLSSMFVHHVVKINNMYGYNIYNDVLKVENSTDICIVKVNNLLSETKEERIYKITIINTLKMCENNDKYLFDEMKINNRINLDESKIYLAFNSVLKNDLNYKANYNCDINISNKQFIKELDDYNESLPYNKQRGKSKKIINYYLDIINANQ